MKSDGNEIVENLVSHGAVSAVIEANVVFCGNDIAVCIAGDPAVRKGSGSLPGHVIKLVVAQGERAGHIEILHGGGNDGKGVGADGISKGAADRVHDDPELFHGDAAGVGYALPVFGNSLRLALERYHAVCADVPLNDVWFEG